MRIALVGARSLPPQHGGLEVVVGELATAFAKLGNEVVTFASENWGDLPGVEMLTAPAFGGKYLRTATQTISTALDLSRRQVDVVHIHGVGPGAISRVRGMFVGHPRVFVTAHGVDWQRSKWPVPAQHVFRRFAVSGLRCADGVSGVSRAVCDALQSDSGIIASYIPNGVSVAVGHSPSGVELPRRFSLVLSRLSPEKRVEDVLNAYDAEVAARLGPLVVVGGGAGSFSDDYERFLRSISSESVHWLGQLSHEEALAVLSRADRLLSMSELEGQPMSVLEAVSAGTPVLLSDIEPHREIVDAGSRLVPLGDVQALKLALMSENERPAAAQKLGPCVELRNWENVASAYLDWFAGSGEVGV